LTEEISFRDPQPLGPLGEGEVDAATAGIVFLAELLLDLQGDDLFTEPPFSVCMSGARN
jgi:hypothetical protein